MKINVDENSDSSVRVVFAIPAYQHAHKLKQTLDSILNQTYKNFRIAAVDDFSTDGTLQILKEYASSEPRLNVYQNPKRLGYTRNANRALDLARALQPNAEYFAWGSDHDIWDPYWLERLVDCLDRNPDSPLAWSWFHRIDEKGDIVTSRATDLGRGQSADRYERVRYAASEVAAGSCLHGLIRIAALRKTGGLRRVLVPDRLLIAELATVGPFQQVPEYLWSRRYFGLVSRARQRRASFPDGPPIQTYLPISVQHFAILIQDYVIHRLGRPAFGPLEGLAIAYTYAHQRITSLRQREALKREKEKRRVDKGRKANEKLRRQSEKTKGNISIRTRARNFRKRIAKRLNSVSHGTRA